MCWTQFKAIGHSFKIWAPRRKLFALPSVSSWLQAWWCLHWLSWGSMVECCHGFIAGKLLATVM